MNRKNIKQKSTLFGTGGIAASFIMFRTTFDDVLVSDFISNLSQITATDAMDIIIPFAVGAFGIIYNEDKS